MIISLLELGMLGLILWLVAGRPAGSPAQLFGRRPKLILDSCALIDGRIVEIVRSGFVMSELVIPQFILSELQMLADGPDSHKRERARYGLDIAHELQDTAPMRVVVDRTIFPGIDATDDKLVALAKKLRAQLYTTDYNLGKVAAVEGVQVLNVNELSQSLRPITLPGEMLNIKIIQKGSNRDQGVGYLEDGTMIVIEGGAKYVGREVPVSVTRMHQTVAGKMVFGQVKEPRNTSPAPKTPAEGPQRASGAPRPALRPRSTNGPASGALNAAAHARNKLRSRFRFSSTR
ncbi:MAG TPA: TRAM domain-containing protein [Candidatus Saccharimonadales bacterium]